MKSKRPLELRHITRYDYCYSGKCTKGWLVRLYRDLKIIAKKFFSDSKYEGGEKEALFMAKEWRDNKLKELKMTLRESDWMYYPPPYISELRSNNTSGVTGVFRYSCWIKKKSGVYLYEEWKAAWSENGKPKIKAFSINKYGEEGAKELAIAHRKKMEIFLRHVNSDLLVQVKEEEK